MLEERGLITTEHTTVTRKDGTKWNGVLKYCIRPVREALEIFYTRQLAKAEAETERQRVTRLLDEKPPCRIWFRQDGILSEYAEAPLYQRFFVKRSAGFSQSQHS